LRSPRLARCFDHPAQALQKLPEGHLAAALPTTTDSAQHACTARAVAP